MTLGTYPDTAEYLHTVHVSWMDPIQAIPGLSERKGEKKEEGETTYKVS